MQIEGITQVFFFPVSCFSLKFTFLPLGDASVCNEKMAAPGGEVVLCVGISHSKSVVTVQRAFRVKHAKAPPADKTIRAWYKQFTETGCLCKQKSTCGPLTAENDVKWVRSCFLHSPKKSTGTAGKGAIDVENNSVEGSA